MNMNSRPDEVRILITGGPKDLGNTQHHKITPSLPRRYTPWSVGNNQYTRPFPFTNNPPPANSFTSNMEIMDNEGKVNAAIEQAGKQYPQNIPAVQHEAQSALNAAMALSIKNNSELHSAITELQELRTVLEQTLKDEESSGQYLDEKRQHAQEGLNRGIALFKMENFRDKPQLWDFVVSTMSHSRHYMEFWENHVVKTKFEEFHAADNYIMMRIRVTALSEELNAKAVKLNTIRERLILASNAESIPNPVRQQTTARRETARRETARREAAQRETARREATQLEEKLKEDTKLIAEVTRDITNKFGKEFGDLATELSQSIRGKKIRNYQDAMASFAKFQANSSYINVRQVDRNAIADALKALDKRTLADNLKRLSASSGLLAKGFTAEVFYSKFEEGCRTDNWKPLMLEIEAMALSGVAAAAMALFLPQAVWLLSVALPPTAAFVTVIIGIAIVASWVNAEFVDKLNDVLLDYINSQIMDF